VDSSLAAELIALDKKHLWHPFTPMQDWCAPDHEPLLITRGEGVWLEDQHGKRYIDGNSSIWTNIHGHGHPTINAAIQEQLGKLEHNSFLGFTSEPAIRLAAELTQLFPPDTLTRVFLSDNGSTAMECALKMAVQYWQLQGKPEKCEFLAFDNAYHGDTLGAAALGGIHTFHGRFQHLGFRVHHIRDADSLSAIPDDMVERLAGVAIEPLIQGAAGMKVWPPGTLETLRKWCDWQDVLLIADEVMTGFGRTGTMFACEQERVIPDFLALSKGITGGYLPLGATLTNECIFNAFLGPVEEMKTFYYGHSYCGNPLGCAAALASLKVFREEQTLANLPEKTSLLGTLLAELQAAHPKHIAATRQVGMIAGIDIVPDTATEALYPWNAQMGVKICRAARNHGLLTRPVRDTLVLMPPLSITAAELTQAVHALGAAIGEVCGLEIGHAG
jgi:adenosylmethionine-8-amino-7-oxononanoate aminotransferase